MSLPADGKYYIVNRETTSDGTSLAVTFNGTDVVLTVTELGSQPTQVWILTASNSEMQTISPEDTGTSYQVELGSGNGLLVVPADGNVWAVRGSDGIYTIQDSSYKNFWLLNEAAVGQHVYANTGSSTDLKDWQFISAE